MILDDEFGARISDMDFGSELLSIDADFSPDFGAVFGSTFLDAVTQHILSAVLETPSLGNELLMDAQVGSTNTFIANEDVKFPNSQC